HEKADLTRRLAGLLMRAEARIDLFRARHRTPHGFSCFSWFQSLRRLLRPPDLWKSSVSVLSVFSVVQILNTRAVAAHADRRAAIRSQAPRDTPPRGPGAALQDARERQAIGAHAQLLADHRRQAVEQRHRHRAPADDHGVIDVVRV